MSVKFKDYWDSDYTDCLSCGRRQKTRQFTATFHCKYDDCDYQEPEFKGIIKKRERVKGMVREIVEYLLTSDEEHSGTIPTIEFPELALPENEIADSYAVPCAGWYSRSQHIINIPQKAFYLTNRDIIETTAHETTHLACSPGHHEKWHHKYMDYRRKAFGKFSSFANEPSEGARYTVNLTKENYRKWYGYDLEDLTYDPYEDD